MVDRWRWVEHISLIRQGLRFAIRSRCPKRILTWCHVRVWLCRSQPVDSRQSDCTDALIGWNERQWINGPRLLVKRRHDDGFPAKVAPCSAYPAAKEMAEWGTRGNRHVMPTHQWGWQRPETTRTRLSIESASHQLFTGKAQMARSRDLNWPIRINGSRDLRQPLANRELS